MKGRTLDQYVDEKMKDREFKEAWQKLDGEFELLESMISARERAGISQAELAKRIGTKQPALSRLEKGGYKKATIETLQKIADAMGLKLVVRMEPKKKKAA